MKFKVLTSVLALAITAGAANAGTIIDIYAGATVGGGAATVFADGKYNTDAAQSYGLMAGIDMPLLRFEAEYNYLNLDGANLNVGMVNAYFKMPATVILPYAGLGIGSIFGGNADGLRVSTTPAYQGMLGASFDIAVLPLKFDIEGRAMYSPNLYTIPETNIKPDLLHYDLRLKVRYVF